MKFITDSRALLNTLPVLTGNAARLGMRLSQALDLIEQERNADTVLLSALDAIALLRGIDQSLPTDDLSNAAGYTVKLTRDEARAIRQAVGG